MKGSKRDQNSTLQKGPLLISSVNYHYSPTISSGFCEGLLLGMITNKKEQLGYLTDKDREKL